MTFLTGREFSSVKAKLERAARRGDDNVTLPLWQVEELWREVKSSRVARSTVEENRRHRQSRRS
jgi:hypothetical protein